MYVEIRSDTSNHLEAYAWKVVSCDSVPNILNINDTEKYDLVLELNSWLSYLANHMQTTSYLVRIIHISL